MPRRLLDPRPADIAAALPIRGGVNIPVHELVARTHELPPGDRTIEIAEVGEAAQLSCDWLRTHGRNAVRVLEFSFGPDDPGEVGRLWEPNPFLAEAIAGIPGSTALELACGTGRDAVFLASCGWHVLGVDILPDALQRAAALEARCSAAINPVRWRAIDLEAPQPQIEGSFDLITVFRFLHRPLASRLRSWLNPGGIVLCETFTTLHRERHGKPARDAHVLRPGELPELFAGFEIQHFSEAWRGTAHTARLVARLPA